MAQLTLGFGSSHGPILGPPEDWVRVAESDKRDTRFDYMELLRNARPGLDAEITPERMQARSQAVQAAVNTLRQVVVERAPDTVLVLSNPHGNVLYNQMQPVFGISLSATPEGPDALERPRFAEEREAPAQADPRGRGSGGGDGQRDGGRAAMAPPEGYPTDPELADHLMASLVEEGFDIACAFQPRLGAGTGRDHAYSVLYTTYLPECTVPMVPFVISRYAPNLATPSRCYALGQALRRAIEGWRQDKKVAIMASGGLSHQILDEELDHTVIDSLGRKDAGALCSLPRDRLNRGGGTPEILNWVALAGAMGHRDMTLVNYVPCYRSLAGTGHGMTFAYWT